MGGQKECQPCVCIASGTGKFALTVDSQRAPFGTGASLQCRHSANSDDLLDVFTVPGIEGPRRSWPLHVGRHLLEVVSLQSFSALGSLYRTRPSWSLATLSKEVGVTAQKTHLSF